MPLAYVMTSLSPAAPDVQRLRRNAQA